MLLKHLTLSLYMAIPLLLLLDAFFLSFIATSSSALHTITPTQPLKDGEEPLVSTGQKFALGFFSPVGSGGRYVGIWYNKVSEQTLVWVANRETPLTDSSGVFTVSDDGNLVLFDGKRRPLWSTAVSNVSGNASAKLSDSGNLELIVGDERNGGKVLWESFDHPTHTILPGMKLGFNRRTGLNRSISSWRTKSDPAPGGFSFGIDPRGEAEFFLWKGSKKLWRSGPWNGQRLSGVPEMNRNFIFNFRYVSNGDEVYFTYDLYNDSIASRMTLEDSGVLQRSTWLDGSRRWNAFWSVPVGQCDSYGECGAYGSCQVEHSPVCECLPGFEPKSDRDWFLRDWSGGCQRRTGLECGKTNEGFLKLGGVKVPDTWRSRVEREISGTDCVNECVKNCSCTAYTSLDINGGGSGCLMWEGDLIDLQRYSTGGQDIYIRLAAKDLDSITKKKSDGFLGNKRNATLAILMPLLGLLLPTLCGYCWWRRRKRNTYEVESHRDIFSGAFDTEEGGKSPGLPSFDLTTIVAATKNFALENKLGQGGFGPVYKGVLINGQEIAVKRLCRNSGQGTEEFKNEVTLIAKLQHRNLVRILGFCVQGEEKMLIYEYMPNKSLDSLIFDQTQGMLLDWRRRFHIIMGIARGVLYLHQDSRLRIIHRDLKASNILLDEEMNPKISDFGMARIFGTDQIQANTIRVVGTYGYMSPEYAMDGLFSVKSDVFSFGVLLLEIISGKKNRNYGQDDPSINLIGHVWELWKEGRVEEIVDSSIATSCPMDEVVRCIQVGLLCVQESPTDRPSMSSVVFMLGNATTMSSPKQPAFLLRKNFSATESSTSGTGSCSINEVTVSIVEAR